MTLSTSLGAPIGRALLAFMFILAGFSKLGDISGAMAYTASGGLPGILALPAMALEILGGIAVLVGWQTRPAALSLAAFAILAGILYHYVPALGLEGLERSVQLTMFYKNLAVAGGLFVLAAQGPGSLSLEARRAAVSAA